MQAVMDKIRHDHDFAHEGPTFDRLKRAQPNASDADIRDAIKAAVKMMDDCEKYFDAYRDFGDAIDARAGKGKSEKPRISRGHLAASRQLARLCDEVTPA